MYKELKLSSKQLTNNVKALECGRHEFNRENLYYVTFKEPVVTSIVNGIKSKAVKTLISARLFNILVKQNPDVVVVRGNSY